MGKSALTMEEQKLKRLLATLSMVPEEDLARAEADVLLVRRYGGNIELKLRLIDLNLVHERQLDAIERSLGVKKKARTEDTKDKAAAKDEDEPEAHFINIARLGGAADSAKGPADKLANLKLDAGTAPKNADAELEEAPPILEDESLKGSFVPSWKRKKAQEQKQEQEEKEVETAESADSGAQTIGEQEERLKHIIRHIVKSRTHEAILDFLIKRRMNIVEPAEVAKGLSLKERQVRQILDDLHHAGIIKDIGTHPYALSPGKKDLADLKFFFRLWQNSRWHSKMLKWVLAQEKH